MKLLALLAPAVAICLLVPTTSARAGEEVKAEAKIGPEAEKALRRMCDYYAKAKSVKVDVESTLNISAKDMKQSQSVTGSLTAKAPNQAVLVLVQAGNEVKLICDGKKLYVYVAPIKKYTAADAPADFAALFAKQSVPGQLAQAIDGGFTTTLLRPKAYDELAEGVTEGKLLGEEEVGGAKCQHLRLSQKDLDWEVWIDAGEKPLLRKILADHSRAIAKSPGAPIGIKAEQVIAYKDWAVDSDLPAEAFTFTPPAGVQLVKNLAGGGGGEEAAEAEGENDLVGKPAPDFKLALLDGGEVKLSDYKGKNVVVLDFWASWCGPCRKSLPAIIEVTEAFKDQGVVFLGMNQGETPEKIKEFLTKTKLKFTVVLDKGGKVGGESYGADSIPRTVIVDKEGVVRIIHVGASPDLKEKLTKDLETVLAGKKPGGEKAPEKPKAPAPDQE